MADPKSNDGYQIKSLAQAVKQAQKKKPVTNDDESDFGGSPKDGEKPAGLPEVNPKKFVIINPPMKTTDKDPPVLQMQEARQQSRIDYLIRLGLGNQDHLAYYRQAMSNPKRAIMNPNLRKYVAEVLDDILDMIFEDTQMYNRLRTLLQDDHKELKEDGNAILAKIRREHERSLHRKHPVRRSAKDYEQEKFYVTRRKSRLYPEDDDLKEEQPRPAQVGTDELMKRYADMTPGQSFALIKKALKGDKDD